MPIVQLLQPANPQAPNDEHDYAQEKDSDVNRRKLYLGNVDAATFLELEEKTRGQHNNPLWHRRRIRVTASVMGQIVRTAGNCPRLARNIVNPTAFSNNHVAHGRNSESIANQMEEAMHSLFDSSDDLMPERLKVICQLATFVVEGRLPSIQLRSSSGTCHFLPKQSRPYYEGCHCPILVGGVFQQSLHRCHEENFLCMRLRRMRDLLLKLETSLVVETYLAPECPCAYLRSESTFISTPARPEDILLEQWRFSSSYSIGPSNNIMPLKDLRQALRSYIHISQLSAWYVQSNGEKPANVIYRVCLASDGAFPRNPMEKHNFPAYKINYSSYIKVSVLTLPRMHQMPVPKCFIHSKGEKIRSHLLPSNLGFKNQASAEMERKRSVIPLMTDGGVQPGVSSKFINQESKRTPFFSNEITERDTTIASHRSERLQCDNSNDFASTAASEAKDNLMQLLAAVARCAQTPPQSGRHLVASTNNNISLRPDKVVVDQQLCHSTAKDHCDDISSIFSDKVNLITSTEGRSPVADNSQKSSDTLVNDSGGCPGLRSFGSQFNGLWISSSLPLLGSFEGRVLRGRLTPVYTVESFSAHIQATGSFVSPNLQLPVTLSFFSTQHYISGPYLGHFKFSKKCYEVPRSGTIQVSLFNRQRTLVNKIIVKYDYQDMPTNSYTVLLQRTLNTISDRESEDGVTASVKDLIHLRFKSGSEGQIFLHTDVKFLVFAEADAKKVSRTYIETFLPINPKYSQNGPMSV